MNPQDEFLRELRSKAERNGVDWSHLSDHEIERAVNFISRLEYAIGTVPMIDRIRGRFVDEARP